MNNFEGCGEVKPILRYGSCQQCFIRWVNTTTEGKEWFEKNRLKHFKRDQKEKAREEREKTKAMKMEIMSTSKYWSKVFQPRFNELIRIVDKNCGCIATNRTTGKMNAGHYYHAGHNKTLSVNAHNIFIQSFESNHYQSGDVLKYEAGLMRVFGSEYFEFIKNLRKCPSLHLTKIELSQAYKKVLELKKEYKTENLVQRSPKERILLRNEINKTLGLYPEEFSIFNE